LPERAASCPLLFYGLLLYGPVYFRM